MGRGLYDGEPTFRAAVDRCCELLPFDLRAAMWSAEGDSEAAERLQQTAIAQPALFVLSWATAQLWLSWGVRPSALLGHSIGEYVAACLAGVFSLEDALKLVVERGRLMQEMAPGAMLAIPLAEAEVAALLEHSAGRAVARRRQPAQPLRRLGGSGCRRRHGGQPEGRGRHGAPPAHLARLPLAHRRSDPRDLHRGRAPGAPVAAGRADDLQRHRRLDAAGGRQSIQRTGRASCAARCASPTGLAQLLAEPHRYPARSRPGRQPCRASPASTRRGSPTRR